MRWLILALLLVTTSAFADDYIRVSAAPSSKESLKEELDGEYLLINGGNAMTGNLNIYDSSVYFERIDANTLKLYVNASLAHTWAYSAIAEQIIYDPGTGFENVIYDPGTGAENVFY